MTDNQGRGVVILIVSLIFTAAPTAAFAYIDPNAGGLVLQLLGPLFVAVGSLWLAGRQKLSALLWALLRVFRRRDPR